MEVILRQCRSWTAAAADEMVAAGAGDRILIHQWLCGTVALPAPVSITTLNLSHNIRTHTGRKYLEFLRK